MIGMRELAQVKAPDCLRGARSFEELAQLIQRTLDCEAVVLSLDGLGSYLPDRPRMGERVEKRASCRTITAYRHDDEGSARPHPSALAHPVSAGEQGMRFFAGLPLRDHCGQPIGMLAAMDRAERSLAPAELEALRHLAAKAADIAALQRIGYAA